MARCMMCDNEATVGNMCQDCMNGFNSSSPVRKSEAMAESSKKLQNCPSCDKLTTEKVCNACVQQHLPLLKKFMDAHPELTDYLSLNFHKDLPIPRKTLYALEQGGFVKIRTK